MSQSQLEKKVQDYMRKSQSLWEPITAGQLQAEMDRMAKHSKNPEVLRELFAALGDDPSVIAECLARPILAGRLAMLSRKSLPKALIEAPLTFGAVSANYLLPVISGALGGCKNDTWTPSSVINAPAGRWRHAAVWTGNEMIVWGGEDNFDRLNTGARYDPATDSWTATTTNNAPAARRSHTAIWTGSEMIVWGGIDNPPDFFNTGGRYNPSTDSWTATSVVNAPSGRESHTASWIGSEMIVWGGGDLNQVFNTGGKYNPNTDSWTPTNVINAPSARSDR
jgi:Galactose oxidase, central domain